MAHELQPAQGWVLPSRVGLKTPAVHQRGWAFRLVSLLAAKFGRQQLPDIFPVLHINARLFWPWLFFASRLMPFGRLSARDRELMILRTAWNCRSRYEWGQHVDIGLSAGLSDQEIWVVSQGPQACTDLHDRALISACDELLEHRCILDATWDILLRRYGEKNLIEIMLLIGHYEMLAGFLNSSGLQLESTLEQSLQAFNARLRSAGLTS